MAQYGRCELSLPESAEVVDLGLSKSRSSQQGLGQRTTTTERGAHDSGGSPGMFTSFALSDLDLVSARLTPCASRTFSRLLGGYGGITVGVSLNAILGCPTMACRKWNRFLGKPPNNASKAPVARAKCCRSYYGELMRRAIAPAASPKLLSPGGDKYSATSQHLTFLGVSAAPRLYWRGGSLIRDEFI